ncbi:MAG: amidohydrolase [Oscillospiraceae bacterium]|nr:amidohydrolase [Oscillospiraceae bacterium]
MDLKEYVFLGKELKDTYVVDVHIHVGGSTRYQKPGNDADSVVYTMDRVGVDVVCASCSPGAYCDWKWGNEMCADAHEKYPDRIKAYAVVNPHYTFDLDAYFANSDRFLGLKVIPFVQGTLPIDCPGLQPYYEYADKYGLPVLFHAWMASEVKDATAVAKRYPNARFIFGHSGFTAFEESVAACKQCDNVLLDTTISDTYDGALERLVNAVGVDRVAFGTDLTAFECSHILGRILLSRLSDTDKEKILGLNAKQFLKL